MNWLCVQICQLLDVCCYLGKLFYFMKKSSSTLPNSCQNQYGVAQSCPTLCDSMDCSLLGSSVHGIFQAIVLEWAAISFSRGSSQPRDPTQGSNPGLLHCRQDALLSEPPGKSNSKLINIYLLNTFHVLTSMVLNSGCLLIPEFSDIISFLMVNSDATKVWCLGL